MTDSPNKTFLTERKRWWIERIIWTEMYTKDGNSARTDRKV